MKHFAARFFGQRVDGLIGPTEPHRIIIARSMAQARRTAKALADQEEWRLVEVFELRPDEREEFKAWYVNTITA